MDKVVIYMNIKPLGDRVLIEPESKKEKTETGIYFPDTESKERPERGKIIAIGQGKLLESGKYAPMKVKKGDTILFTKYSPNEFKIDGKEYLIAREEDILAILG